MPFAGDYFVPGEPVEGWNVAFKVGSASSAPVRHAFKNQRVDSRGNVVPGSFKPTTFLETSPADGSSQSAAWVGLSEEGLKISKVLTLNPGDLYFTTPVQNFFLRNTFFFGL